MENEVLNLSSNVLIRLDSELVFRDCKFKSFLIIGYILGFLQLRHRIYIKSSYSKKQDIKKSEAWNMCIASSHMSAIWCDLVPFVQIKKREKHPWRSITFSEVVG